MTTTTEVTCNICGGKFADILYLKQHQSSAHSPVHPEKPTATEPTSTTPSRAE